MKNHIRLVLAVLLAVVLLTGTVSAVSPDPTEQAGTKMTTCTVCNGTGICVECYGRNPDCESCGGTNICPVCQGTGYIRSPSRFYNTVWSLLPPVLAIALALITKEVYSSLFVGVLAGGLLYANFNLEVTVSHVLEGGIVSVLSDRYNVGILVFLVMLGALVALMNKSGGSAAFGRWAQTHIRSRVGAQLATILMGCLIFVDDYFNCLTVGSVMRPITDKHQISRAKLAYLIDSTAAPVCIIAPISSWAAAVAAFAADGEGLSLFIRAIPYNFYALLTVLMIVSLVLLKTDYGEMRTFEEHAKAGDLFSGKNPYSSMDEESGNAQGRVLDMVLPVLVLIASCMFGMIYSGRFFDPESPTYHNFITAFSASDASIGLAMGSLGALIFAIGYFICRRTISFKDIMNSIPEGFKAMVPAIMILTLAWSLKVMTDSLGARFFVRDFVRSSAMEMQVLLPAVVFVIGALLAFATGTSWGTFGMLIPIVQSVFSMDNPLAIICIAACMSGAVCGDHCSPISDTTIMASAGAECDHVNHVTTQLPYALTAACVSLLGYLLCGLFVALELPALLALPIAAAVLLTVLLVIRFRETHRPVPSTKPPKTKNP